MSKQRRFCVKLAKEALRLKLEHQKTNRAIARTLGISKSTVARYVSRAEVAGIDSLETFYNVSDEQLKKAIFPERPGKQREVDVDFEWVNKELKRKHVTLMLLWRELAQNKPGFYQYSRFCDLYKQWRKKKDITMKIPHKAGEKAFIDYAGMTVPVVDKKSGKSYQAQVFVSCLGSSSFTYVEATWTQNSRDFIASNIRSFEYFGGTPEVLVPDNLKSGVNVASKYEPIINRSYREMAKHYGCVVIPTRAYKPKDKGKVENGVLIAERWILARLRDQTFFSLDELNETIWELLEEFNNKKFQKLDDSRRSLFEEVEQATLQGLPRTRYVLSEWKQVKVSIDYHVQVEKCYYSVPYRLRGEYLDCRYTDTTVELFKDGQRVASHSRAHRQGQTSTKPEHMPKSHREHLEWSPSRILNWASTKGEYVAICCRRLMAQSEHPELAYKGCLGIMSLSKKYGQERLQRACERGVKLGAINYRSIKSILEKQLDKVEVHGQQQDFFVDHENIRGKDYYQ